MQSLAREKSHFSMFWLKLPSAWERTYHAIIRALTTRHHKAGLGQNEHCSVGKPCELTLWFRNYLSDDRCRMESKKRSRNQKDSHKTTSELRSECTKPALAA